MTPIKLTSTQLNESDVLVMFDKITHIESARTAFGDEYARIHLGNDMVEVKETPNEVFKLLAIALHKGLDNSESDPTFMDIVGDSEPPSKKEKPDLSTEGLMKDSIKRHKERNN